MKNAPIGTPYKKQKRILAAIPAGIVVLMTGTVLATVTPDVPQPGQFGSTVHPVSLEALTAGCGEIFTYAPGQDGEYAVIPENVLGQVERIPIAPMIVPVYGYMTEQPLTESEYRFYERDDDANDITRERLLASMYQDNATVFWYSPEIPNADYLLIQNYVEANPNTVAVQWSSYYGQQALPFERNFAVSQWGVSQSCDFWSDVAMDEFVDFATKTQPADPSTRPEPEVITELNEEGELPPLQYEE